MTKDKNDIFKKIFGEDVTEEIFIKTVWGVILPHLGPLISQQSRKLLGEKIENEAIKNILASFLGSLIQLFEHHGVYRDIIADILENVTFGIRGKKSEDKTLSEISSKISSISLEELEIIKNDPSAQNKRIFLEYLISSSLKEKIKEIKDEDLDLFIDTLINIQKLQKEIKKEFGTEIQLKELWLNINKGFLRFYEKIKEKYPEIKKEVRKQKREFLKGWKEGWREGRKKGLL